MQNRTVKVAAKLPLTLLRVPRRGMGVTNNSLEATKRPLSPHVDIYGWGVSMVTSGTFRATGMFLWIGIAGLSILNLPNSTKYENLVFWLQKKHPWFNSLVKFGVAFPVTYHLLGGLRHLAWDNLIGNNMTWNRNTGLAAVATATAVGLTAAFYETPLDRAKKAMQ